ncbi:MAG: DEAD/DEAH box helicase family protein [Myxococcota bacterium]|nr:DEAD/DEAH box helicase family protein [Myxococcota bacterium]
MRRLPALRRWQKEALERFEAQETAPTSSAMEPEARSFLAVATPGAGKTVFALMAARRALVRRVARGLVVVVPTAHLKLQWADAAEGFGLFLEPEWSGRSGLPRDAHGIVVTYQQLASSAAAVARIARGAFAVLDEIHHAGESRAWGEAVRTGLDGAARRLCISGTPFRSDDAVIPFVRYQGDEAQPDYEYGYGEALADRAVVRPVYFPRVKGEMSWRAPDGGVHTASFDDALGGPLVGQRLRTALSLEGEWLPAVLGQANEQLQTLRAQDPTAGGLVIATDQDHAHGIASLLRQRLGQPARVATSDDPDASRRIAEFRDSRDAWLVAVRMVSEGVDIPRLRVGVYATTTTTELFFRQAVGRFVRFVRGRGRQPAFLFIPDDPRLREAALGIKRARRHQLRPPEEPGPEVLVAEDDGEATEESRDLFAVIESRALDSELLETSPWDAEHDVVAEEAAQSGEEFLVEPVPLPKLDPRQEPPPVSRRGRRRWLRDRNQQLVIRLAQQKSLSHAEVNRALNRRVGLRKGISEATESQLEARLREATAWLHRRSGS